MSIQRGKPTSSQRKKSPTDRKTQRIRSVGFFYPLEKLALFVKILAVKNLYKQSKFFNDSEAK
jgi:hypothetical protein